MKALFKILFFIVCIAFFTCTKKRECKNMPNISGDIIERIYLYQYKCYDFYYHIEIEKKRYLNTRGNYFFDNEVDFKNYLLTIQDTINYSPLQCEIPIIDFTKYSVLGFLVSLEWEENCYSPKNNVTIDRIKKTVNYTIYNCSPNCGDRGEIFEWVVIPKVDSTYKINYVYEKL